jgi:hypothetical protein
MPNLQHHPPHLSRRLLRTSAIPVAAVLLLIIATLLLEHHAEPIVRSRIVSTLEARYHTTVELDQVTVSVLRGLQVDGRGLRVMAVGDHARLKPGGPPMLQAREFQFATTFGDLLFHRGSPITAYAQGVVLTIPAANDRKPIQQEDPRTADDPRNSLFLNRIIATNSTLVLESADPAKAPVTFNFAKLILFDEGKNKPFAYETILTNPEPVGQIHSTGHLGPWRYDDPAQTPVDGDFTFDHADLSTLADLHGTLTAAGRLAGTLGQIAVHGTTDTPDFALDVSAHPFALHTEYQALVDGITSAVALQAVTAHFLHTTIETNGLITQATGINGHRIALDFRLKDGRAEDLLTLFNSSKPPLLSSAVTLEGHIDVPPGSQPILRRIAAHGKVALAGTTWSNPSTQQQIDALSLRAQDGHLAKQAIENPAASPLVTSTSTASFVIQDGNIDVSNLLYKMPGTVVLIEGRYPLVGRDLDFHGIARTTASATQMESGIKSLLTKPISPLLHKNKAGMQIPISFTGDKAHPDFHLDLTHPNLDKPGAPPLPPPPPPSPASKNPSKH